MQIQNVSLQLTDYNSPIEKTAEKPEKPEVKAKKNLGEAKSRENSENLNDLAKTLEENNITLSFSRDEETKAVVVKLVDTKTGEAIRQIPSEVSLKLAAVNAKLQGNFVDEIS